MPSTVIENPKIKKGMSRLKCEKYHFLRLKVFNVKTSILRSVDQNMILISNKKCNTGIYFSCMKR